MNSSAKYGSLKNYDLPIKYEIDIKEEKTDWNRLLKTLCPEIFTRRLPFIDKVIFNPPATVVIWSDGTKTVVKARKGKKKAESDEFSEEIGLAVAIAKKYFGSRSAFLKAVEAANRSEGKR